MKRGGVEIDEHHQSTFGEPQGRKGRKGRVWFVLDRKGARGE